ncbi:MAG TPA: GDSL-type esterase/lipase family protein [Verrucomicrobiae bacterium]
MGDSITEGGGEICSYLGPLQAKLQCAGYQVEFVGTRTNLAGPTPIKHEGHSGKNAEYLEKIISPVLRSQQPDIVLIHAGHNHDHAELPVPGILRATEDMIRTAQKINPQVIILVAQVIPSGKLPKYAYLPELNLALGRMIGKWPTPAQPVLLVDMAADFNWAHDTLPDHVHPNPQGAEKIAAHWFSALSQVLPPPTAAQPAMR